jgi:hypothetical protein
MNRYSFSQGCRPQGDFRVEEVTEFLHLFKEGFGCSSLYDSRNRPVDLTESGLRRIFKKEVDERFRALGVNVDFFTIPPDRRDDNTARIEIHTGTYPEKPFIDSYDIVIGDSRKVPDFSRFERSVEILRPFEGYISESLNESAWNTYDRQQAIPKFDKPAIIRGWHYLDEGMAQSIGGIRHCLKAPAWHVERFCEGVLIQLVPGLFDSDDSEHLDIQKAVMEYFHMI